MINESSVSTMRFRNHDDASEKRENNQGWKKRHVEVAVWPVALLPALGDRNNRRHQQYCRREMQKRAHETRSQYHQRRGSTSSTAAGEERAVCTEDVGGISGIKSQSFPPSGGIS